MLGGAWTAVGVVLLVAAPLTAPLLLGLAVIAPLAWYWAGHGRLPRQRPSAVEAALLLAGLYLLVNASWSLSRADAYASVALLFAAVGVLHVTAISLPHTPKSALNAMGVGLLVGMAVGAAILCFELLSDQWLHRLLATHLAAFRPSPRHMHIEAGRVTHLELYLLNRGASVLALTFWPALLALERLTLGRRARALLLAGLCLAPVAIFASEHATSKLAFLGAAAIYGIGRLSLPMARRLLIAGWLVATLLVVPIAELAYSNHLHLVGWLGYSMRHRIVIWKLATDEIVKAPLLGAGVSTPRALHHPGFAGAQLEPGTDIPLDTPLHSHNAYLQVWYETGAVGAMFLLAVGLLMLRGMAARPPPLQRYLYATFACCALLAASSYSLWAPWFMSALALTPVFAGIGAALYVGD